MKTNNVIVGECIQFLESIIIPMVGFVDYSIEIKYMDVATVMNIDKESLTISFYGDIFQISKTVNYQKVEPVITWKVI